MTEADRRVATLAALLAPERAAAMLAHLGMPGAAEASAHAVHLCGMPRRERLLALSRALAPDAATLRSRAEAAARAERGRVASAIRALAAGTSPPDASSAVLLRLCRERLGR